ncbi:hypothetical protein QR680_013550 [Steinernema hermaphroditum]|uniref:Alpha-mannosidase n=1 Tax=Steinernema hermaphroditum TaxID=289476 RepID=A0AA39M2R0_9BILA|nr:hypothetical protein QR680_013550 [Steinernema hermaphroditum]
MASTSPFPAARCHLCHQVPMRCLKATTIGLIFALVTIYSVAILFVGDYRQSFHSVLSYLPSGPRFLKVPPREWVSVESVTDADLDIDGTGVKLSSDLGFNHTDDEQINIHLVLHSHVDPGWLETFDEYYEHKVHNILTLAVEQLTKHADMRFIWSEVSFLERWWSKADETQRENAKKLVAEGRLEVCGGSWVMTDEATPYFWASIDNLIEGQRFLTQTFHVSPKSSWSVDPFGHGSMVPYLLPLAGIENMVIGRINNELKQEIRQKSLLTLNWKQSWKNSSIGSPQPAFVNVLPNKYYTTSDACGPDLHVCCQFDIGPSARSICSKRADDVSPENVANYAEQLADQYRKLSKFYRTSSVLVPVGDDFFFSVPEDWSVVYGNYKQLIDYINNNPKYHMNIRFSTVGEFFDSIDPKAKASAPTVTGDFFPYLDDASGPYPAWTGYYAHLPYHKRMGRIVEEKLRSLDLLRLASGSKDKGLLGRLIESRRNLALFQHHDGITGTSRKHVMQDFLQRLYWAFDNITEAQTKLLGEGSNERFEAIDLLDDNQGRLLTHRLFKAAENAKRQVTIFNPLTIKSTRKVVLRVDSPKVAIASSSGRPIPAQILPQIIDGTISSEYYDLLFFVHMNPLEKTEVSITFEDTQPASTSVSRVHSASSWQSTVFEKLETGDVFYAGNQFLKASFINGKLTKVAQSVDELDFSFDLAKYADRGGAYVFVAGEKTPLPNLKTFFYVQGPLCRRVLGASDAVNISHTISVFSSGDAVLDSSLDVEVLSNVHATVNENFVLSLGSEAFRNNGTFYTDANGLHMMKRRHNSKESIPMNFYPSPSTAFLEDSHLRLSLLTGQPTAVASLSPGFFEFMVDRQLSGDDGKGLSFGEADTSLPSRLNYRILIEPRRNATQERSFFHSALGFHTLQDLLYPVTIMTRLAPSASSTASWPRLFEGLLPCDVELVTFRFLSEKTALVLLRRLPLDSHSAAPLPSDCSGSLDALWSLLRSQKGALFVSNLTGTHKGEPLSGKRFAALFDDAFLIRAIRIELP